MSMATLSALRLVLASPPIVEPVPARIVRRAKAAGWPTCEVCTWPIDPAAVVPGQRLRHPGCECAVCHAPLVNGEPGVLRHPWCDPSSELTHAQRRDLLRVVSGGVR